MKTLLFHNYRPERLVYQNIENGKVAAVNIVSEKSETTLKELETQDMNDSNVRKKLYEKVAQKVADLKDDGKTEAAERLSTKLQVARAEEAKAPKDRMETPENIAQQLLDRLLSIARKESAQFAVVKKAPSGNKMSDAQAAAVKKELDSTFVSGKDEVKPNSPAEKVAVVAKPLNITDKTLEANIKAPGTSTVGAIQEAAKTPAPAMPQTKQT